MIEVSFVRNEDGTYNQITVETPDSNTKVTTTKVVKLVEVQTYLKSDIYNLRMQQERINARLDGLTKAYEELTKFAGEQPVPISIEPLEAAVAVRV